jgi:gluconate 2-dehydrogenase gamma chain
MEESHPVAPGHAYAYLMQPEVRFLDAAVARLIPADELGPGAKEADVTYFIDRQLMSSWGTHGRNYRMGPWREGTPQQGFQSRLTPQEIYRLGIRETDIYCTKRYGKAFCFLKPEQQDEVLHALEDGEVPLESLSSKLFFSLLWRNTDEGFFSDPMYGGNRDKIGWKLIGFPGVASSKYNEHIEKHNVPYRAEPVSILDIQQRNVKIDEQGFPVHVMVSRADG